MDISKKYIEKSKKATVLQENWYPSKGDYFSGAYQEIGVVIQNIARGGNIWLPRQDQLQEMIEDFNIYSTTRKFENFVNSDCFYAYNCSIKWSSMEQLWLAFVMKEKYNKIWDGKDWIKA